MSRHRATKGSPMPINVVCLAQRPAAMSLGSHTRCIPIRPQKVVLENGRESIHHVQSPCIACKLLKWYKKRVRDRLP